MDELIYPREKALGTITLVLGIIAWLLLVVGTVGGALLGLAFGFIIYLFAQSTLISYIKGNGVELSETQFPDLYSQYTSCCQKLNITDKPKAYILNGNGGLNAFATKFLRSRYVVLMTDIVDAMDEHSDGVRFYIGHELGHLRMRHLEGSLVRWPVLWLPLLGAAYSRARESTCDRHGLACSDTSEGAARALAALSAGVERWRGLDLPSYVEQAKHTSGFWMSFHELTQGYPWLTKRVARVIDTERPSIPRRNPFAYLIAIFVPFAGRLGGGFGLIIMIYIIGILAAIALPAYQDYTTRAHIASTISSSQQVRDTLGDYFEVNGTIPDSLDSVGLTDQLPDGSFLHFNPEEMAFSVDMERGELIFVPQVDEGGEVYWICSDGEGLKPELLPAACEYLGN